MITLFSKRHSQAIFEKRLRLTLPVRLRKRLWLTLEHFDYSYWYRPNPNDSWSSETTVLAEIPPILKREYGSDELIAFQASGERGPVDLQGFVEGAWPSQVLDVAELFHIEIDDEKKGAFHREVNRIFQEEASPWRLADGLFFRIDSDFLAVEVLERTQELLKAEGFAGALDEFREARNDLTTGDNKGAIRNACNAFESTMKAALGVETGNASALTRRLKEAGFLADLPENVADPFAQSVLMALPFLGNRLARHGQGQDVVDIPREYAELAVHLAASLIAFCVQKTLTAEPVNVPTLEEVLMPASDDDIPS